MLTACQLWENLLKVGKSTRTIVFLLISRYVIRDNIQGTRAAWRHIRAFPITYEHEAFLAHDSAAVFLNFLWTFKMPPKLELGWKNASSKQAGVTISNKVRVSWDHEYNR
eukprot:13575184-Ditylum_brightwellii.AAC.1